MSNPISKDVKKLALAALQPGRSERTCSGTAGNPPGSVLAAIRGTNPNSISQEVAELARAAVQPDQTSTVDPVKQPPLDPVSRELDIGTVKDWNQARELEQDKYDDIER